MRNITRDKEQHGERLIHEEHVTTMCIGVTTEIIIYLEITSE